MVEINKLLNYISRSQESFENDELDKLVKSYNCIELEIEDLDFVCAATRHPDYETFLRHIQNKKD